MIDQCFINHHLTLLQVFLVTFALCLSQGVCYQQVKKYYFILSIEHSFQLLYSCKTKVFAS
jgi:hypothetical protein